VSVEFWKRKCYGKRDYSEDKFSLRDYQREMVGRRLGRLIHESDDDEDAELQLVLDR